MRRHPETPPDGTRQTLGEGTKYATPGVWRGGIPYPDDRVRVTTEINGVGFPLVSESEATQWAVRFWYPFESWGTVAAVYSSHSEAEQAAARLRAGQWHERVVPGSVAGLDEPRG